MNIFRKKEIPESDKLDAAEIRFITAMLLNFMNELAASDASVTNKQYLEQVCKSIIEKINTTGEKTNG